MPVKTAHVATSDAGRYIPRLCRHFSHKAPAVWDETTGRVEFPVGTCHLKASNEVLVLRCESDSEEGVDRVCSIVGSHLTRFAMRARDGEELHVVWHD